MDQGLKSKTLKTFRKKKKKNLGDLGEEFLYLTPKPQSIKGKVDKLNLIIIKNLCSVKLSLKKMKRRATKGKNLQATYSTQDLYLACIKNS